MHAAGAAGAAGAARSAVDAAYEARSARTAAYPNVCAAATDRAVRAARSALFHLPALLSWSARADNRDE